MIKKIKIFTNDNEKSINLKNSLTEKLVNNGFIIDNNNYDLALCIGGDGTFLKMVRETNFNSDIYYVGINSGTLGFMQEVASSDIDLFIDELTCGKYKKDDIAILECVVESNESIRHHYALNEVIIRDENLKALKSDVIIDNELLEHFTGDGILVASSNGSTAHNLSFGGSIIYNNFISLQITPIAPLNSKKYQTLTNSIVIPKNMEIKLLPKFKDLLITIDGIHQNYKDVNEIKMIINDKKIKVLRFSNYNFSRKIREKLFI